MIGLALLPTLILSSCGPVKAKKTQAQECRELQLKYDYHNGEATLWSARGEREKAEKEMMAVVKVVLGSPVCFPEKIIQDIQYYYTTLPGITKTEETSPTPSA